MSSHQSAQPDVLFVNGASSAGKTSLIRAVQDQVPVPYLHVGLDHFFASVPEPWGGGATQAATPARASLTRPASPWLMLCRGRRSRSGRPERECTPPIGGLW